MTISYVLFCLPREFQGIFSTANQTPSPLSLRYVACFSACICLYNVVRVCVCVYLCTRVGSKRVLEIEISALTQEAFHQ